LGETEKDRDCNERGESLEEDVVVKGSGPRL
jgi:hypothetical protein